MSDSRRFDWVVARRHVVPIVVTTLVLLVFSGFLYGFGRTGALVFQLPPIPEGVKLDAGGVLSLFGVAALFGLAMWFGSKTHGLLSAVIIGVGLLVAAAIGGGIMTAAGASLPMLLLALATPAAFTAVVAVVHLVYVVFWSKVLPDRLIQLRGRLRPNK